MPLLTEDRELLMAFRRGDRDALARVYAHYAPMLADFLRGGFNVETDGKTRVFAGLRSPWDLYDALQESFVKAFGSEARSTYDGLRPFRNYLFRIGRNVVIDQLRRGSARRETSEPTGREEGDPSEHGCETSMPLDLLEREAHALVEEFVAELPDMPRRVFQARFEEGVGQRDAAEALGLTRIQLRRIEARIKIELLAFLKTRGYLQAYEARGFGPALSRFRPDRGGT